MHRQSVILGVVLTGVVLGALLHWAGATPVILHWINPSGTGSSTEIIVGPTGEVYGAVCGPGETCETTVELPSGETETFIFQCNEEGCSAQSNVEIYTAAPPEGCVWDFDGSGTVTPRDFGIFLAGFGTAYNAVDFGAFLRVFGGPCS